LNAGIQDDLDKSKVKLVDSKTIGSAVLPWNLFYYECLIYNERGDPVYRIRGRKFQCQTLCCPLPMGYCTEAEFTISIHDDPYFKPVGYVFKRWSGWQEECLATAPMYIIEFPVSMDWKNKVLVIAGVQLLDMHFFQSWCPTRC